MTTTQEIKIGTGLNNIKFGISRDDLKAILGEPSEMEQLSSDEEDEENEYFVEAWHYDELDLSFSFDEEDDWRLTGIASNSDELIFKDMKITGMSLDDIKAYLIKEDLGEFEIEELGEDQKLLSILSLSSNFWFEDNKLTEVQWSVLWENEDTPIWP